MSLGAVSKTAQLREVPIMRYVTSDSFGLTETRDKREALTLASILQHINANDLEKALDVICMRLLALQEAKQKGSS